jgi:hypothetical protein
MATFPTIDDDLIVSTLVEWQPKIFDNLTNNNPLLRRLRKGGHIRHVSGGTCMEVDVMYKQNTSGRWFKDDDTFTYTRLQTTQALYFDWYYYNASMVIWGTEWAKNKGSKTRKFNLLETRKDNLMKSVQNDFGKLLWVLQADATASTEEFVSATTGAPMFGVPNMVADTSTNKIGGVQRTDANKWWKNQTAVLPEQTTGATLATAMSAMIMKLTRGSERPTVIFMSMDMYALYMQYCEDKKRISGDGTADGTFKGITHQGIEILYDPNIKEGHVFFLNENYIKLNVHPDLDFKLDVSKKPIYQYMEVYPLYFMGGFTLSNSALQGVLYKASSIYSTTAGTTYPLGPGPAPSVPYDYSLPPYNLSKVPSFDELVKKGPEVERIEVNTKK